MVVRRFEQARKEPDMYSPPKFHSSFELFSTEEEDPRTVKEAIDSMEGELWKKVIEEEMESLRKNDTWDLVGFPDGRKKIYSKWVFKRKTNVACHVEKF